MWITRDTSIPFKLKGKFKEKIYWWRKEVVKSIQNR